MSGEILSGLGSSDPVVVRSASYSITMPPGIIVTLSPGASLTYQIEVTGDATQEPNYIPSAGNWNVFDGMSGLTASANGALAARVTAIRCTITSYTSGSLNFVVVQ